MKGEFPFQINTDISVQDLMRFAEFKMNFAQLEEDPKTAMILRVQAKEIHFVCEMIMKSAIQNSTGINYLSAYEIPTMLSINEKTLLETMGIFKKMLPALSSFTSEKNGKFKVTHIEEAKEVLKEEEKSKEIIQPTLPLDKKGIEGDVEEIAKKVAASDEEFLKMVKDTVIDNIKQSGGRMEAVRFLTNYAFKSLNWTDIDAHRFINRFKEIEDIVEPPKNPRKKTKDKE
jgi:hypothetical protein